MTSSTKERPILFNGAMTRATLNGSKDQTRRVMKHQPYQAMVEGIGHLWNWDDKHCPMRRWNDIDKMAVLMAQHCPYGQPGDRLWVRETWQGPLMSGEEWEKHHFSGADEIPARFRTPAYCQYAADGGPAPEFMTMDDEIVARWKPSIHMPRWASRILLEITSVRAEPLHAISESDASREGLSYSTEYMGHWCGNGIDWKMTARQAFRDLWLSTGGDWAANPWVWVIGFKQIQQPR